MTSQYIIEIQKNQKTSFAQGCARTSRDLSNFLFGFQTHLPPLSHFWCVKFLQICSRLSHFGAMDAFSEPLEYWPSINGINKGAEWMIKT